VISRLHPITSVAGELAGARLDVHQVIAFFS
jgi:hypothetical protein